MSSSVNRTHAFPGMGADHRMFPPPWREVPGFTAHDWMPYGGETRIAEVAQSMAHRCEIRDGDSLIGTSLGGIIACEVTKLRRIERLILVGSAISKDEISGWLATLHPLAQVAPIEWLQVSAGKMPTELLQMFASVDGSFIRSMCRAIFEWPGLGDSETQLTRIHGKRDLVIPPPRDADLIVDGGHLISMTHASQCAEFIVKRWQTR